MKVLQLIILTSILTYAAARVVGPQLVDSRKKVKLQSKQEDDEGVIVDPVITVSDIQVYENSSPSTTTSSEENNVDVSSSVSSEITSTETESPVVNEDDANPINRYCKCTSYECDCCREFSLPLVPIRGPGCANIRYLEGDRMSVGIKFGNRVLANRIISGRKDTPVCLPLPGGFTNFCGRIYGISKKNEEFKACLGLELRADEEVEAALRVSCFSFGPRGLKVMEAEPIPVAAAVEEEDDDDDIFGLGGDDDEDDDILDDDDDTPSGQSAGTNANGSDSDDDDETDYTGLSLLSGDVFDELLGDDDDQSEEPSKKSTKKKNKGTVKQPEDSLTENEVDGPLNGEQASNNDDDDDDDDNEEEESGGILEILNDLISDDDDDAEEDEEEIVEDEISEEIAENELNDAEEIVEETDETSPIVEKDNEVDSESDLEEEELAEAVDDDDDDEEDELEELDDKPTSYAGLSLLGLRNIFSRFFK